MSSNSALNTGKSLTVSPSPSVQSGASPSIPNFDSSARRPNQGGNHHNHPSSSSIAIPAAPRKGQAARKQHRGQRRPGQGGDHLHSNAGARSLDDDDAMAELRAVRNPSSRRGQTSITHLMNYTLPPRPYQTHHAYPDSYARSYRRNPTWGPGSGHHAVDKARYVHANYRFVVSPDGSYATQAVDADEHLQWADVLQVLASTESQQASCPICLSEPVAPRMAKCGHIFCLSCLIRFMNSSSGDDDDARHPNRGSRWKKCPICEDAVYLHEVRPVRFYAGQESPLPRPGDDVVLRLMARHARSTLALPWEGGADGLNVEGDVPWHFAANVVDYARIMKGTGDYMVAQFDEEIEALLQQEKEDELLFHEDGEWTQKAIRAVNAAKEKVRDLGNNVVTLPQTKKSVEPDFFFYTAPPHLYLSPLDIRILKTKYGSFSSFPSTLLPRVEHISTGHVVDDALRRRAKYLNHLPHGCIITFLECDWTDIVPAETLDTFRDEIEKRRKRNSDKAAQEERERLQAERIEAAQIRSSMGTRRPIVPDDEERRPVVDFSDFQPLAGTTPPSNPERPGFEPLASMSTSPSAPRTVWGTPAVAVSPDLTAVLAPNVNTDDGWLKDEDFLGAAELAVQMEALGVEGGVGRSTVSAPGHGGGGKKKKKQKITLMSTGGRRGN